MRLSRLAGLFLFLATIAAAQDEDPVGVLMNLRDQVVKHNSRIPNYTCVETVQRHRFEPVEGRSRKSCDALLGRRKQADFLSRLKPTTSDRLRLDVVLSDNREIFSWVGAKQFDEGELDEWIPEGAIGTGPFTAMLLSVFAARVPRFGFDGDTTLHGRRLLEYSFTVSQEESHHQVKAGSEWIVTGYTGTLLVDPATAELVQLRVRTEELPSPTTLCETETTLDYGKAPFSGAGYFLPAATRQRFIATDGSESENTIDFASCREFRGESKVAFGEHARTDSPAPPLQSPRPLPAGLPMTVDVVAPIDCDRAAAGDPIEGRLAGAVRDEKRQVLVPEGARLAGRLMRVETAHTKPVQVTIAIRWETVDLHGTPVAVSLIPNRGLTSLKIPVETVLRSRGVAIDLPPPNEGKYGIYHFPGEHPIVPGGLRTEWLTASH